MSTNLAVFISCILCGITIVYIVSTLIEFIDRKNIYKIIILILLITIITYISYSIKYSTHSTIIRMLLYILAIKTMTKEETSKVAISLIVTIILMSVGDIITNIFFLSVTSIESIRSIWYYILLSNLIVNIITLILINIRFIKNKLTKIIKGIEDTNKKTSIALFATSLIVIIYVLYNISINYKLNDKYIINVIIMSSYFIIVLIFFRDKMEYIKLINQYDALFEYFKEIEENIDNISINNHEYKNQLAVLKEYINKRKNKEATKYINDIIQEINIKDKNIISNLKNVPKGGIKGLLYYKNICAKNRKIEIVLDISKSVTKELKKLTINENKIISKALGVYIDNAIQAVEKAKNRIITIEIYSLNNEIMFIISNYFNPKKVDINKISKKGYSTKGKGRGQGVYLITKIINREKWINQEKRIINNFYTQKLSIKINN